MTTLWAGQPVFGFQTGKIFHFHTMSCVALGPPILLPKVTFGWFFNGKTDHTPPSSTEVLRMRGAKRLF